MNIDGLINGIPIRKLYVAPILPQMVKRFKQYFERFGEVESIHMHTKGKSQFAFIQYKSAEVAKEVLSMSKHRIANHTLTVKPAHDKHQPDFKEFKPPKQDSPQHILNALNDDCLERVFRQLELLDLSAAADVCVRFQQHAIGAFESKYKQVVKMEDVCKFKDHPDKLEMMFRNFGSMIHSIGINNNILETNAMDILKMANKNAPALKHLGLVGFNIHENVDTVHPLFAKLEMLTLFACEFTNGAEKLLTPCAELNELRILCVTWDNCCIDQSFPKLEKVHLSLCKAIEGAELEKFFASNSTLKNFSIGYNVNLDSAKIVQSICQHLKNLEELEVRQYYHEDASQFECLSQLDALKKLTLKCNGISVTSLLNKLVEKSVPLEYLSLDKGSIDGNGIKSMAKLKKLKEIKLDDISNLTDDHVIELAKELPQLNTLHLEGSTAEDVTMIGLRNMLDHAKLLSHLTVERANNIQFIGKNDYRSMLKSVQERPKENKLEIKITGDGDKLNVPESILSANRNWLWIDEEIEDDEDEEPNYDSDDDDDDDDDDWNDEDDIFINRSDYKSIVKASNKVAATIEKYVDM